jgi:hypothetical protein
MLYEDETTIIEYIQELISILVSCGTDAVLGFQDAQCMNMT